MKGRVPETGWSHAHALPPQVNGLVALAHGVLIVHAGLLVILRRLLFAVLAALVLAVFRAGLAGSMAVILIHDYHLTVSSMPLASSFIQAKKNFFKATHP